MTELRLPAPDEKPVVLTVAGSDSGGGAGIQADLKTIEATDGFGTSAVTAVTAQNTRSVDSTHVLPTAEIAAQIDAVRSDFDVQAVKTGMLATAEVVERVAADAAAFECPVVVDPVMVAATGDRLLTEAAESAYEALVAEATLVTPNADEAAVLTDIDPVDEASARAAGREILAMGADAALVKGGHIPGDGVIDVLVTGSGSETMRHPRIDTDATHGSGCTLSAAIATRLGHGDALPTAVERSTAFMERALRYHHAVGSGPGAVHHLVGLRNEAARNGAIEAVYELADALDRTDPDADVGGIVAATPYAETTDDVATLETDPAAAEGGRSPESPDADPGFGRARFGASGRLTRTLLEAREADPSLRVGVERRLEPPFVPKLEDTGWTVVDAEADGFEGVSGSIVVSAETNRTALLVASDANTLLNPL